MSSPITLKEASQLWAKIGLLSFGGPAAQIALMHKLIVEDRGWLSERQFLNALSFCMLLPGPEAMQLATFAGWRLHGIKGGLAAGLLFVAPGALIILVLSILYGYFGNIGIVSSLFLGVKAAVLIIVIEALLRVSKKALKSTAAWIVAGLAFVGLFFLQLPYPLIILCAGLYGFVALASRVEDDTKVNVDISPVTTIKTVLIGLCIWFLPIIALDMLFDLKILIQLAQFFSQLAVVTFGGAYAVLAYMAQDVVQQHGWLTAGEMIDGLGLAETTPGPLILVTQFVGYLTAFKAGGFWLAIAGTAVTLWVTFVPCFIWIFAGAPYMDWISNNARLSGALSAIIAAVVGVILNLSLWFALQVFFKEVQPLSAGIFTFWWPDIISLEWRVPIIAAITGVLLLKFHWNILKVLLVAMALGWVFSLL